MQRGYSEVKLFPYFLQGLAVARRFLALPLEQRLESKKLPRPDPSLIFFHLKFHSQDPISSSIQALWRETVLEPTDRQPFNELLNCWGHPIGIKRLVVAYSRHLNLGNTLSIRRFDRLKGPDVSSFNLHEWSTHQSPLTLRDVFTNPLVGLAVVSRLGTLETNCPYLLTRLSIS